MYILHRYINLTVVVSGYITGLTKEITLDALLEINNLQSCIFKILEISYNMQSYNDNTNINQHCVTLFCKTFNVTTSL